MILAFHITLNIHSHVRPNTRNAPTMSTKYLELEGVDSQMCPTFLWIVSDIFWGIYPTWEYERWYTWSVL
jgi:hypothetical protein